jgi:hypothetical protein
MRFRQRGGDSGTRDRGIPIVPCTLGGVATRITFILLKIQTNRDALGDDRQRSLANYHQAVTAIIKSYCVEPFHELL